MKTDFINGGYQEEGDHDEDTEDNAYDGFQTDVMEFRPISNVKKSNSLISH